MGQFIAEVDDRENTLASKMLKHPSLRLLSGDMVIEIDGSVGICCQQVALQGDKTHTTHTRTTRPHMYSTSPH